MKPKRLYLLDKVVVGDYSVVFGHLWHAKGAWQLSDSSCPQRHWPGL
jgi:hypothetical protein